uniref:ATP synthase subunit a n=1 Tax=Tigriopus japonicus TaxID=158387 RepID=Q8M6T9_TIGJA|nr:adenosine triphosphatase subunit 6 [Tigriopus japonicus]
MGNLFGVFSPYVSWCGVGVNWVSVLIILVVFPTSFWVMPYSWVVVVSQAVMNLKSEFSSLLSRFQQPGSLLIPTSMFAVLVCLNLGGLLPYVFTGTAHLSFTLSLGLPLWLGQIVYSSFKQPLWVLAHLVPQGAPGALSPFMVLIELVSNVIRPLTLGVRLFANLTAGHILVVLLSGVCGGSATPIALLFLVALLTLELAVSVIQGYVFSTLNVLYFSESETKFLTVG